MFLQTLQNPISTIWINFLFSKMPLQVKVHERCLDSVRIVLVQIYKVHNRLICPRKFRIG